MHPSWLLQWKRHLDLRCWRTSSSLLAKLSPVRGGCNKVGRFLEVVALVDDDRKELLEGIEEEKVKKEDMSIESWRIPRCVRKFIGNKSREHYG